MNNVREQMIMSIVQGNPNLDLRVLILSCLVSQCTMPVKCWFVTLGLARFLGPESQDRPLLEVSELRA